MHRYFIKTPWWVKKVFPAYVWNMPRTERTVYLTFDDGPHPVITPWVLDALKEHGAKATFFCIGDNVAKHPETFQRLIDEGHSVGNHTQRHLNGWKTASGGYLNDVAAAAQCISSALFRPPYGRLTKTQASGLNAAMRTNATVVMWDVLSADFDLTINPDRCTQNVLRHTEAGSVVVFHDSEKAFRNLEPTLPKVLKRLCEEDYRLEKLPMGLP